MRATSTKAKRKSRRKKKSPYRLVAWVYILGVSLFLFSAHHLKHLWILLKFQCGCTFFFLLIFIFWSSIFFFSILVLSSVCTFYFYFSSKNWDRICSWIYIFCCCIPMNACTWIVNHHLFGGDWMVSILSPSAFIVVSN